MKSLLLLSLLLPSLAHADDAVDQPVVDQPPAPQAKPARKKIYFRAGVARITPLEQSREMELADVDGAASLALQNGPIAGSGATVSSATIPGVIVGYVLPFGGDKLSVETILGLPFTVTFKATGTLANESLAPTALGLPTGVPALGPDLGEAKAVPIVLTAVYQVAQLGKITPYVGAGPSIMFATGEKVTNMQLTEVGTPKMSIAPAPGLVLQAGIDAKITNRIYARVDVKFIALMLARATVEHVQVKTPDLPLFDSVEVGTAKMSMWLNPLVVQAGIGTDF
ncbi:MAG TPA: OmpW family outer membrane protein [Kofleriaceae bacterium]